MKARYSFLLFVPFAACLITPSSKAQLFSTLYSFSAVNNQTNSDGANPHCALLLLGNRLYGTTDRAGFQGYGSVFAVQTNGTNFTVLHSFNNQDGAQPESGLVTSGGILYGTTDYGGPGGGGTVFSLTTNGSAFNLVHFFTGYDGFGVLAPIILSGNTFYGTTWSANNSAGNIFSVAIDGSNFDELYAFSGNSDGGAPQSPVVLGGNVLYGTTTLGGDFGQGTIFAVGTDGTNFAVLHSFTALSTNLTNSDGANPYSGLVLSGTTLYGTADAGGIFGYGTIFKISTNGTGFAVLHSFAGYPADGSHPLAGLLLVGDTLYGAASSGGSAREGTIFEIKTNGTEYSTLYNFSALTDNTNTDGAHPQGKLILSGDKLYGTTYSGGTSGNGTVFSLLLRPELNITRAGTSVLLTWSTNAVGFTLQSSPNIASASVWTNVSPAPVVVNGQNVVTNAASAARAYYRLSQ